MLNCEIAADDDSPDPQHIRGHSSQAVYFLSMHDTALALALVRLSAWEELLPLRRPTCYDFFLRSGAIFSGLLSPVIAWLLASAYSI